MEKRYTSNSKRIVTFSQIFESEKLRNQLDIHREELEDYIGYSNKISQEKTRQFLNQYLQPFDFRISKDYTCAHNIGNNHRYDIIDLDALDGVETHIGYLSINNLMGYSCALYLEDLEEHRISSSTYTLGPYGLQVKTPEGWYGWDDYNKEHKKNWNLSKMEKELEIRQLIHEAIDHNLLDVVNGFIMVQKETEDQSRLWMPCTYEECIDDLKNEKQFQSFKSAVEEQIKTSKLDFFQKTYLAVENAIQTTNKFMKDVPEELQGKALAEAFEKYMKNSGIEIRFCEAAEHDEYYCDFDMGTITATFYVNPKDRGHLVDDFEIYDHHGGYYGNFSKVEITKKIQELESQMKEDSCMVDEYEEDEMEM